MQLVTPAHENRYGPLPKTRSVDRPQPRVNILNDFFLTFNRFSFMLRQVS